MSHVNLVDFIQPPPDGVITSFPSEVELSVYTRATERYFPRDALKEESLLTCLLRNILRPSVGRRKNKGRNRDRGKEIHGRGSVKSQ